MSGRAGRRAIGISGRGTGRSSKPRAGYGLERLADDVVAVLDALDVADAALVGWSFGGLVAFRVAAPARERVERLVLVGSNVRATVADGLPFGVPEEALERHLVGGERDDRLAARRRAVAGGFPLEPAPDLLDWLMTIQLRMPSWSAIDCFPTYARADQRGLIGSIRQPVLQLVGEHDLVPVATARWLHEQLANATLVGPPSCAHTPMREAPEAFESELFRFRST